MPASTWISATFAHVSCCFFRQPRVSLSACAIVRNDELAFVPGLRSGPLADTNIMLKTKFTILNARFIILNTQFIIFNLNKMAPGRHEQPQPGCYFIYEFNRKFNRKYRFFNRKSGFFHSKLTCACLHWFRNTTRNDEKRSILRYCQR